MSDRELLYSLFPEVAGMPEEARVEYAESLGLFIGKEGE